MNMKRLVIGDIHGCYAQLMVLPIRCTAELKEI